jgi:flagellar assembly protein FliH
MSLIRAAVAAAAASRDRSPSVVRFSLRDFRAEAERTVAAARHEADELLAAARTRAAELEAAARDKGHADGWRQGYHQGQKLGHAEALEQHGQAMHLAAQALTRLEESIESARAEVESAALSDVVRLALAVAERVTKRAGRVDPSVLAENLREAMRLAVRGGVVRVHVNPQQRRVLDALLPQLRAECSGPPGASAGGGGGAGLGFEVVDDEAILPGGCRIVTSGGRVDADLQTQLDRLAARLLPDRAADRGSEAAAGGTGGDA